MSEQPPREAVALAERRAQARARQDFALADALRDELAATGWHVVDEPSGAWRLEPVAVPAPRRSAVIRPADVPSVLDAPPTDDASVHWVVEGWPDDVVRAMASFRAHRGDRAVRYVVTDVTGGDPATFISADEQDVEVLSLEPGTGWGAAVNAGLRRATGRIRTKCGANEPFSEA